MDSTTQNNSNARLLVKLSSLVVAACVILTIGVAAYVINIFADIGDTGDENQVLVVQPLVPLNDGKNELLSPGVSEGKFLEYATTCFRWNESQVSELSGQSTSEPSTISDERGKFKVPSRHFHKRFLASDWILQSDVTLVLRDDQYSLTFSNFRKRDASNMSSFQPINPGLFSGYSSAQDRIHYEAQLISGCILKKGQPYWFL